MCKPELQRMKNTILTCCYWIGFLTLTGCFPHEAGRYLQHFNHEAPEVGTQAPEFNLLNLKGEQVSLTTLFGDKPVVLQFGSHSCPVYRYRRGEMEKVYQEYRSQAHFVIVYTLEAHPVGTKSPYSDEEWVTWINRLTNVLIPQTTTEEARQTRADQSREDLDVHQVILVDTMDNAVWRQYGSAPSSAFVIDHHGSVVLRQVWIDPDEIRVTLQNLPTKGSSTDRSQAVSLGQ